MLEGAWEELQAELRRLDLLLHREILRLRAAYQLSLDEFRGLYISDEQVDSLVNQAMSGDRAVPFVADLTTRAEALRTTNATLLEDGSPWRRVVEEFSLTRFEQDVLLLALAPEVDLKYQTLYAYLNNDITRRWPTRDLALRLFVATPDKGAGLRRHLLPEAPLFRTGLLQVVPDSQVHRSWLATGFDLAPMAAHHLLGIQALDPQLASCVTILNSTPEWDTVPIPASLKEELGRVGQLLQANHSGDQGLLLIFEGRYGAGRAGTAGAICRDLGLPLLQLDLRAALNEPESLPRVLHTLALQQRLQRAGVFVEHGEVLFDSEGHPLAQAFPTLHWLVELASPAFFACTPGRRWHDLMRGHRHRVYRFDDPAYPQRRDLWEHLLTAAGRPVQVTSGTRCRRRLMPRS
jgi:hypothetical protein